MTTGDAVVVWIFDQESTSGPTTTLVRGIRARRIAESSTSPDLTTETLAQSTRTITGGIPSGTLVAGSTAPELESDGDGRLLAVWTRQVFGGGSSLEARAQVRAPGTTTFPSTPADGALVATGQAPDSPLALSASGATVSLAFTRGAGGVGEARASGGSFAAPSEVSPVGAAPIAVGGDGLGQLAYAFTRSDAADPGLQSRFFDRTPPVLAPIAETFARFVGTPIPFATSATDSLSPTGTIGWDFGDGTTGSGPSVEHAYASPGVFTATASVADAVGNAASRSATAVAVPPPDPPRVPAPAPPPAPRPAPAPRPRASKVRLTRSGLIEFTLDRAGRVAVTAAKRSCRRVRGKRRCTFARTPLRRTFAARRGRNTTRRPALARGATYRVVVDPGTRVGRASATLTRPRKAASKK